MSALTPERLAEIRERAKTAEQAAATGTVGSPPNVDGLTINEALELVHESAEDVPDLLVEVERFRAGIEAARTAGFNAHAEHGPVPALIDMQAILRALLNPTEGETDE